MQQKNLRKKGLNESQVRQIAKNQGYSTSQIDDGIKKAKETSAVQNIDAEEGSSTLERNTIDRKSTEKKAQENFVNSVDNDIENFRSENDNIEVEINARQSKIDLKYFGYDIFTKDPSIFQSSLVGAVDPNYLIGPGDEIIVMLWGETQFRQVLSVDREGFVFISDIGQVFVNGLNLSLLEAKLFRCYHNRMLVLILPGEATTFLDVSIGDLRPLRIQVLGEVGQPGAYIVSPSASLFSSLYYFKGPNKLGSLRDIQLIRDNKIIASVDFYDYLLTGKKPDDEKLQLDDVVFIPKRLKTISIDGEVNRPRVYELKPDETLADVIKFAGGLKIAAYLDRAQIDRIVPFDKRELQGMDRMIVDVKLDQIIKKEIEFELQDNDSIQIFSIASNRQNMVTISGSIVRPGNYDLGDGMKLSELIIKADSLLGDAYLDRWI